jgi:radical SAM protein with 4Fe4S-binding SPASM domain
MRGSSANLAHPPRRRADLAAFPEVVPTNPWHVWIEPTNRCNTRCSHCWHFYVKFGEDMADDVYEKIAAAVLDSAQRVELVGYGEPLLAKGFERMLNDCIQRGVEILTTSNGILLQRSELLSKMVRGNVHLNVSVDGARAETFDFVRPFVRWERLIQALERVRQAAEDAGPERRFDLYLSFVPMKKNIGDLPDLVRLAARFGASSIYMLPLANEDRFERVNGQSLHDSPELVAPALLEALRVGIRLGVVVLVPASMRELVLNGPERGHGVRGRALRFLRRVQLGFYYARSRGLGAAWERLLHGFGPRPGAGIRCCLLPWGDAYFAADGSVFPCCVMGEKLGDISTQPWEEIWNGPLYRNLRRTVHSWNPSATCRFCPVALGINGSYEHQREKFFARYRREEVALDSADVEFCGGFDGLERLANGSPSHRWMGRRGTLALTARPGARFLRLLIIPRAPVHTPSPGWCRVNGGAEEPFDNTCSEITFPVPRAGPAKTRVEIRMESAHRLAPDPRQLGLAIRGIEWLV